MQIIPAIIGRDIDEIEEKVEAVGNATKWVHLDVSDGVFAPPETWPYYENEDSPSELDLADFVRTDVLKTEVHLMVKNPEKILDKWLNTGSDRILIHHESTDEKTLKDVISRVQDADIEVGLVLCMETPVSVADKFMEDIDVLQLMSISKIGAYGEKFDPRVFERLKELFRKYPGASVSLDGGINSSNLKQIAELGVENAIVGSNIFGDEEESGLEEFSLEKNEVQSRIQKLRSLI